MHVAFERTYSRLPTIAERDAALTLVHDILQSASGSQTDEQPAAEQSQEKSEEPSRTPEIDAWASLYHALFGSAEFRYLVDID